MMALLLFLPAVLALALVAVHVYRSYALGAELLLAAYLLSTLAVDPITFMAGGFNIVLDDFVGVLLITVTAARWLLRPEFRSQLSGWMPFALATSAAFAFGTAMHGLKAAGVEFRGQFYLCAAVLYCASFPLASRQMRRLVAIWLVAAALLMGVAWLRWTAGLLGLGIAEQWAQVGGGNRMRVLNASQTMFLAQAFLMLLYLRRHARSAGILTPLAASLALTVVLLQHRSVWIATTLTWGLLAWREGELRWFLRRALVAGLVVWLLIAIVPDRWTHNNDMAESMGASVAEPFNAEKSTLLWRVVMWNGYLFEYFSLPAWQWVVGTGLGNPGLYRVGEIEVGHAAHNYFVFLLNRTGLLGLAALVAGYVVLIRRLRKNGTGWNYLGLFLALTCGQLIYFTVYSPTYDQGLLIGAAFSLAAQRSTPHAA